MCVVPSAVGCPVCHLVFLPRPNAPLHHRFRPPSPPPATWRCLRASYLHRLGRIGAFRTRPPPASPSIRPLGHHGGNSLGRSPHSNAQADGDTCRSFARPAWLHRTMPEASITREGERGEDLHSTWGQKRAAYHPSPPRQRVRTRCENQAYIARTPWEKTQPSQQ